MSVQSAPSRPPDDTLPDGAMHRRRPAPEEHLCTCGRPREDCVRDAVRALWLA